MRIESKPNSQSKMMESFNIKIPLLGQYFHYDNTSKNSHLVAKSMAMWFGGER